MNVSPDLLRYGIFAHAHLHSIGSDYPISKVTTGMSAPVPGPSEADVQSVCEISGIDRAQAITLLKVCLTSEL